MAGTEYPKIDTLYDRDEKFYVVIGKLRRQEFGNIKRWSVTEKINGRNTRISLYENGKTDYGGKTDEAEMPPVLLDYLKKTFTPEKLKTAFWLDPTKIPKQVTMYGEGYGPNMTPGSGVYCKQVSFRLFDCLIDGWWLERPNLENVAEKLGIKCVPIIAIIDYLPTHSQEIQQLFQNVRNSLVAVEENNCLDPRPEGIVARTEPLLFNRKGERVMWKLKLKDFKKEE